MTFHTDNARQLPLSDITGDPDPYLGAEPEVEFRCLMMDSRGFETGEVRWMTHEEQVSHFKQSSGDFFPTGESRIRQPRSGAEGR